MTKWVRMIEIDIVFSGGGIKGLAFVGALEALETRQVTYKTIIGSSAGALIGGLVAAGYQSSELKQLALQLKQTDFLEKNVVKYSWQKWVRMYYRLGLFKGDKLEKWIDKQLKQKKVYSFADLKPQQLKIIVSDLTRRKLVVFPDDLADYGCCPESFSVAKAIRMSCTIPYIFEPVRLKTSSSEYFFVDGGVLSHFPYWLLNEERRPNIGFYIGKERKKASIIKNNIDYFQALLDTMLHAHDIRYVDKFAKKNTVFLPINHVQAIHFSLTEKEKKTLFDIGRTSTERFLKTWP